jgi:hypothetical protein
LNELAFNNAMLARLTDQMHINQQILIIDCDFYSVSYFQVRQPLGSRTSIGTKRGNSSPVSIRA